MYPRIVCQIRFTGTDGALYRYTNVSEEVHLQLMHAASKGEFWRQHVHGFYPYERVATTLPADL